VRSPAIKSHARWLVLGAAASFVTKAVFSRVSDGEVLAPSDAAVWSAEPGSEEPACGSFGLVPLDQKPRGDQAARRARARSRAEAHGVAAGRVTRDDDRAFVNALVELVANEDAWSLITDAGGRVWIPAATNDVAKVRITRLDCDDGAQVRTRFTISCTLNIGSGVEEDVAHVDLVRDHLRSGPPATFTTSTASPFERPGLTVEAPAHPLAAARHHTLPALTIPGR
jgi:hypothetical protein